MSNRVSVCLVIYAVVVTTTAGIMAYFLLQPCGIESEVDGENNKVRNQQKIDILSLDFASDTGDTCNVWSSYGFEAFEYIILIFPMISIVY